MLGPETDAERAYIADEPRKAREGCRERSVSAESASNSPQRTTANRYHSASWKSTATEPFQQ